LMTLNPGNLKSSRLLANQKRLETAAMADASLLDTRLRNEGILSDAQYVRVPLQSSAVPFRRAKMHTIEGGANVTAGGGIFTGDVHGELREVLHEVRTPVLKALKERPEMLSKAKSQYFMVEGEDSEQVKRLASYLAESAQKNLV